jgi:hypothetical protein
MQKKTQTSNHHPVKGRVRCDGHLVDEAQGLMRRVHVVFDQKSVFAAGQEAVGGATTGPRDV